MLRLVCLWLFDTRDNLAVQCWGNSEAHSRRVQYTPIARIIQNTPSLRKRIPEKSIMKDAMEHGSNGSRIMAMVGGTLAALFISKNDAGFVHDGALAGLVAVCAGSDLYHPVSALVVGAVAFALLHRMNRARAAGLPASDLP